MRLLTLALVGASALALSACDELAPRQQAKADCCCKDRCPTPAPAKGEGAAKGETGKTVEVATSKETTIRTGGHVRKVVRHRGGGSSEYRYSYRSGTEGVGYLDEGEYHGGYRRVGGAVVVDERETYSESARYSESSSGYRYSTGGGVYASGGSGGEVVVYDSGGRPHGRRGGGGYAGVDRDGYLTWPGKTE